MAQNLLTIDWTGWRRRRHQDLVLSYGPRNHAPPMVQQIESRVNKKLEGHAKSFLWKFRGYHYTPNHPRKLKGLKQKGGESFRNYYRRFCELRAQVHDITEREVIEAYSHGIMAMWQFQDFCKENPRNNEEFRCTVEKMITTEEKTREWFPERSNRDNPGKQNHRNNRHQERKRGPDNTKAVFQA